MDEIENDLLVPLVKNICLHLTNIIGHVVLLRSLPSGSRIVLMQVPSRFSVFLLIFELVAYESDYIFQVAHEVSLIAAQLNGVCEKIACGSDEIIGKRCLLLSLKNINLFSHELAVISRVGAVMKTSNNELFVG